MKISNETSETFVEFLQAFFAHGGRSINKSSKDAPEKKLPAQASPAINSNTQAPKVADAKTEDAPEKKFPMPSSIQATEAADAKTQDAPQKKLAMLSKIQAPKVADAKTPSEAQPILSILPGVSNGADTSGSSDTNETSAALPSASPSLNGKGGWAKLRGNVVTDKSASSAEDAKSGTATDDAGNPKPVIKGAMAASLKAVSAFQTATKLPDSKAAMAQRRQPSISSGAKKRKESLESEGQHSKVLIWLRAVVRDSKFTYFFGFLIVTNSLTIGLQADFVADNPGAPIPIFYQVLESFFCFVFLLELAMKITAEGKEFFLEQAWRWNVLSKKKQKREAKFILNSIWPSANEENNSRNEIDSDFDPNSN